MPTCNPLLRSLLCYADVRIYDVVLLSPGNRLPLLRRHVAVNLWLRLLPLQFCKCIYVICNIYR